MPRPRKPENVGLPPRWKFVHGAYYYQVPENDRHIWGGKLSYRLGATLEEAHESFAAKRDAMHPDFRFQKRVNPLRPTLYDESCGIPYGVLEGIRASSIAGAKARNLSFDLVMHDLVRLANKARGKCMLTGIAWDYKTLSQKSNRAPWKPSLDRIDPNRGYEFENVRLVCIAVNIALSDFGDEVFMRLAQGFVKTNRNRIAQVN